MNTPTETPTDHTATKAGDPTAVNEKAGHVITEFPMMVEKPPENEDEYVVDVETHVSMLVQATTPEMAAAKAVLHTVDPEEDGSVTEVGRTVHTCVHSGLEESDSCDQHGEHNEE